MSNQHDRIDGAAFRLRLEQMWRREVSEAVAAAVAHKPKPRKAELRWAKTKALEMEKRNG